MTAITNPSPRERTLQSAIVKKSDDVKQRSLNVIPDRG